MKSIEQSLRASGVEVFLNCERALVLRGDALRILREIPDESVDAVVTDPPYSSGGLHRSDRGNSTSTKYVIKGTQRALPEFFGDNRDQRSFVVWASLWLAECWRITKPGGYLLCFTDWRQLPSVTDAVQAGGYVWRGIVPWDKTEASKPQMGWFRAQAEYVVTASRGSMGKESDRVVQKCLPGVFREGVRSSEKLHMTGKPVPLMQRLLEVVPPDGIVLDPFAGSGTTLVAARNIGLRSVGIEISDEYCAVIKDRLSQDVLQISSAAPAAPSAGEPDLLLTS